MNTRKPETRRYDVTIGEDAKWLGTFIITHDGMLSVKSEYGSYSYWWQSTGEADFRTFLIGCDDGYVLRNLSPIEEYDGAATEKSVLDWINKSFQSGELPEAEAEALTEEATEADFTSEFGMHRWLLATKMPDPHEQVVRRTHPRAVAFIERVWPLFRLKLQQEILSEEKLRVAFPDQLIATIQLIGDSPEDIANELRYLADRVQAQGTYEQHDDDNMIVHVRVWANNAGEYPIDAGRYWAVGYSEAFPGEQFALFSSKEFAERLIEGLPMFTEDDPQPTDMCITRARVVGTLWNSYDPDPEDVHPAFIERAKS